MPGIVGMGLTYNLPNFVGELFRVTPTDTPFLSAIGGLTGGERTTSTLFQWQGYDLRDAAANRQRTEGANAPQAEARTRFNFINVVEIHHETVETSYTKLAATGQYASTGSANPMSVGITGTNPVVNEHAWQIQRVLEQVARDIERSFIIGKLNNPSDNTQPRRTRGIMDATATNVLNQTAATVGTAVITAATGNFTINSHGLASGEPVVLSNLTGGAVDVVFENTLYYVVPVDTDNFRLALRPGGTPINFTTDGGATVSKPTQLTESMVLDLLQLVWENGGIQVSETATVMCGAALKRALTKIFITDKNYQEMSRNVAGVSLTTVETDFGRINLMLNRYMPTAALQVVSLEQCTPVLLEIPGKGFLFEEPLSKTGSAERTQIYGEIGLKWGNELAHGKLLGVKP